MNVFLTMDYELFFGDPSGSPERCMLDPTEKLMQLAQKHNIGITYFVDVGYLIQLKKHSMDYPELNGVYTKIVAQLHQLLNTGNDIQLHIHPHWEAAFYDGLKWNMSIDGNYKLSDFNSEEIVAIVTLYKEALEQIINRKVDSFRAGGWCLQPFSLVKEVFKKVGIRYDSTVFPGAALKTKHYAFDFKNAPKDLGRYRFEDDLCVVNPEGSFTELPIGGWKYHPIFYWNLYVKGRIKPDLHKMMGDGMFISQAGRKYTHLSKPSWNHVSCDGYFAKCLPKITKHFLNKKRSDLVIIGHPKGQTKFSIKKLDQYIETFKTKTEFLTFKDL